MRQYRKQAGITLKRLGELCDCNYRYLSQIETGQRCPSLALIEKIANAVQVKPSRLLETGEEAHHESLEEAESLLRQIPEESRKNLTEKLDNALIDCVKRTLMV
jgi:transcriptional regulator with XRE-family HTH domain